MIDFWIMALAHVQVNSFRINIQDCYYTCKTCSATNTINTCVTCDPSNLRTLFGGNSCPCNSGYFDDIIN